MRTIMGKKMALFGVAAALTAALLVPARSTLAVHESICFSALNNPSYNVIIGVDEVGPDGGTINGTSGADVIIGTAGPDTINAGAGTDVVCGRGGGDQINGGSGNDDLIGDIAFEDAGGTTPLDPAVYGEAGVAGDDRINGGSGNDRMWGDGAADALAGSSGNDALIGNAGADDLDGGSGADSLNGGTETDSCAGGSGNDTAQLCEGTVTSVP